MPTMEEVAKQPLEQKLQRMTRTPDDLAAAIKGQSEAVLGKRPDAKNWAPKEVVCHLRDTEELFTGRFEVIMATDDPKLTPLDPATPDRWAEERQYMRNDADGALAAFRKRRSENLEFLKKLSPDQWTRGGIHPTRGRITINDWVSLIAWHDDNHLDQLNRGLAGQA